MQTAPHLHMTQRSHKEEAGHAEPEPAAEAGTTMGEGARLASRNGRVKRRHELSEPFDAGHCTKGRRQRNRTAEYRPVERTALRSGRIAATTRPLGCDPGCIGTVPKLSNSRNGRWNGRWNGHDSPIASVSTTGCKARRRPRPHDKGGAHSGQTNRYIERS